MSFNIDQYTSTKLNRGEAIISFKGIISSDAISTILIDVEEKFLKSNLSIRFRKKTYNILVECMQNLYHHCITLPEEYQKQYPSKYSIVYLSKIDNTLYLTTGNFVLEQKVKSLSQKNDKINTLSQEDLKEMYKFILNHQKLSAKGGGGLGMIDVARKSGHKLTYEFLEFNKDYYFYLLNVKITED